MNDRYRDDLRDFSIWGRQIAMNTLKAWNDHGLPSGFEDSPVKLIFDKSANNVLLENEGGQRAMLAYTMRGYTDLILLYHTLPGTDDEGFLLDLMEDYSPFGLEEEDINYIKSQSEFEDFSPKVPLWTLHTLPDSKQKGFLEQLMIRNSPDDLSGNDEMYIRNQKGFDQALEVGNFPDWQ